VGWGAGVDRLPVMSGPEDTAVLGFERSWRREPGAMDQAIELEPGLSAAACRERHRALVAARPALAYDPLTAKRVRAHIEESLGAGVAV